MKMPMPGECWRHYKGIDKSQIGRLYQIVGTGYNTETGDAFVVYQYPGTWRPQDERALFVRPLSSFLGTVKTEKGNQHRFIFERETY